MQNDHDKVLNRFFEIMGGRENAFAIMQEEEAKQRKLWDRDTDSIGRILRAHLFVEHYMALHIQSVNPNLGPVRDAKLGFWEMTHLLDRRDGISKLIPGLRHLNKVRNRLAHRPDASVSKNDTAVFLQDETFRQLHEYDKGIPLVDLVHLEVLENYALYAGRLLDQSSSQISMAISLAHDEVKADMRAVETDARDLRGQ